MKLLLAVLVVALCASSVAAFADIESAHVENDNGRLDARISIERNHEEDLKVTLIIPELGYRLREGPFEDSDSQWNVPFREPLPDVHGDYLVRITVSNDDGRKVVYRYVTI
ncbi:hypothetical protein HY492_03600 [Candidatus Woesearchaeota archaeon]|nr:hypothetical protein [Candidatus Woesearchaeota archaeon]